MQYSFRNSKHSDKKRANKNNRLSDSNAEYEDVAIEYFTDLDGNLRCALSGEILGKENFSKEHIIAIAIGGHDIAPNIVPSGHGYNTVKNDMYILKYLELQENNEGEKIYNPYRLLKMVNYMLKSINARGLDIEEYRKALLTANDIDKYLIDIEKSDKDKIYSANIAPQNGGARRIEDNSQEIEYEGDGITFYTFISDVIRKLQSEGIIPEEYIKNLEEMLDNTKEIDVFKKIDVEVDMRQEIIQVLRDKNIGNEYDIAYIMQQRVVSKEDIEEKIGTVLDKLSQMLDVYGINKEWASIILENRPEILLDVTQMSKISETITFYANQSELDMDSFIECFNYNKGAREYIEIVKKLNELGLDISEIKNFTSLEEYLKENGMTMFALEGLRSEEINMKARRESIQQGDAKTTREERKILQGLGILTEEDTKKIEGQLTRNEKNAVDDYLDAYTKLEGIGVDLSKLGYSYYLENFLREKGITLEELGISISIDKMIRSINSLKNGNFKISGEQYDGLKLMGILTEEDVKRNVGEIERREGGLKASDYIEIFIKLKDAGMDLNKLSYKNYIEEFLREKGTTLEEIGVTVDIKKIESSKQYLRSGDIKINEEQYEILKRLGIFDEDHVKKNTGEIKRRESGLKASDYIEVYIKLKDVGMDLSKLGYKNYIEDFLREKGITLEELGVTVEPERIARSINSLRNESIKIEPNQYPILKELGILTEEDIKKIEKEIARREKGLTAGEYIDIFIKLKDAGMDLSKLGYKNYIEVFLQEHKNTVEEFGLEWITGDKIRSAISNLKGDKIKITGEQADILKELGVLNEEDIKKINGEIKRREKKDAGDWIEIFEKLENLGLDLGKIRKRDSLKIFLEKQGHSLAELGLDDVEIGTARGNLRSGKFSTTKEERIILLKLGILTEEHIKDLEQKDEEKAMKLMKKSVGKSVENNQQTRADIHGQIANMSRNSMSHSECASIGR